MRCHFCGELFGIGAYVARCVDPGCTCLDTSGFSVDRPEMAPRPYEVEPLDVASACPGCCPGCLDSLSDPEELERAKQDYIEYIHVAGQAGGAQRHLGSPAKEGI